MAGHSETTGRDRPDWLKKKISSGERYFELNRMIRGRGLHTVCSSACCPNQAECYSSGTSTFMILGDTCTRNCRFCAVHHGSPGRVDPQEPSAVARAIHEMGLRYAVITSVTRDDLGDGGAGHFSGTIAAVRKYNPETRIEVLVPDFNGAVGSIGMVVAAGPDVLNHNVETVPRLYPRVRPQASYSQSIEFFRRVKAFDREMITKSGLMLGLGETDQEVERTLVDLHKAGCEIVTLGQYLAPSPAHYPVMEYVTPDAFQRWQARAVEIGFGAAVAGPFVRSSYHASETFEQATERRCSRIAAYEIL